MPQLLIPIFIFIASLSSHQIAQAASMETPQVEFSFYSKDGLPVEGIALTGMLQFEALTFEDCSEFICVPSRPHYKPAAEAAEILGETDRNGQLVIKSRNWESTNPTAKNLSFLVFTNGVKTDLCKDGNSKQTQDLLKLLPSYIDGKPVTPNEECSSQKIANGVSNTIRISCYSPYSQSQIEEMEKVVLSTCSR